MIAAAVVFAYLGFVLYVGIFAFRRGRANGSTALTAGKAEDFFVANRSLGTFVFLLSLFGSNMTSFAILGSSGLAFRSGIGVYGLMASISGIVIPLSIFVIGPRIWAIGKKFGHMTQVQIFRDRWEMGHIGTVIFALQALMLVPYIIIGVMGGGETLEGVSKGAVPYWIGGLVVALVVMSYVFFGGMRGTAWVNTVQTLMFLVFGTIAFAIIAHGIGGFGNTVQRMADTLKAGEGSGVRIETRTEDSGLRTDLNSLSPQSSALSPIPKPSPPPDGAMLIRGKVNPADPNAMDRVAKGYWFSYSFIPLSSIMFPHIAIFCLTARRMASFRKTVILYPLCIMAIWLPAVFLGTVASSQTDLVADLAIRSEGFSAFEIKNPPGAQLMRDVAARRIAVDDPRAAPLEAGPLKGEMRRLANSNSDGVMLDMLNRYAPAILAGILGAAIMACVMATDSQILALSTMWATDVYRFYGGRSEVRQIWSARVFVVAFTIIAYVIALAVHEYANIFELAIQYAFSGYASMAPIMLACLFWKRSTKWGALASTLWVAFMLAFITWLQWRTIGISPAVPTMPPVRIPGWELFGEPLFFREYNRVSFTSARFLMVFPMFVGAAVFMWLGSILTPPPSRQTLERYFPARDRGPQESAASEPALVTGTN